MSADSYIVIDACIAGAWMFQEEFTPQALTILNAIEHHRIYPIVPDRFSIEVLRICQKKTGAGHIRPVSSEDAWERFQLVAALPILSVPMDASFYARAWKIAHDARLTVHDALYVALAQEWNAPLWTLDIGLASTPASVYSDVFDLRAMMFPY